MPPPLSARGRSGNRGSARAGGTGERSASAKPRSHSRAASVDVWQGRAFYVQVERCYGISDQVVSVRLEEEKYVKCSEQVKAGIERYFDGQLLVDIVNVPALYALEVRLMPDDAHPRHGKRFVGQDAEAIGCRTIFSKVTSKRWPKVDALVQQLESFCRVPVRIILLGRELRPESPHSRRAPASVRSAANGPVCGGVAARNKGAPQDEPQGHATIILKHSKGFLKELHTNAVGEAEASLFPGNFMLTCEADSNYDRLSPEVIAVPSRFALMELRITASMKKRCVFLVVDHLGRPFPRFPLRLRSKESADRLQPISVQTKVNGRGKARLGRGIWIASYDAGEDEPRDTWPVQPVHIEFEVQEAEVPQFFRICVNRIRFSCDIMLRTRFQEPVALCPFKVRSANGDRAIAHGQSTDIGLASCDLPVGRFAFWLEAVESSPFVPQQFEVVVKDDASFTPLERQVETKSADVVLHLITPDGEAAAGCMFHLSPQFSGGGGAQPWEMSMKTDSSGCATASMCLLEPYVFSIKELGKATEYMPQEFTFLTDRRHITVVVARTVLGPIPERNVVLAVDASGSMGAYLADVKAALNLALVQQLHRSPGRTFNIVACTGNQMDFHPGLVESTPQTIENAMRFCEAIEPGGASNLFEAIRHAFKSLEVQAVYLITDGKCELGETFLTKVRALYLQHPGRPKVHTVGINCVPQRLTHRGLQAVAAMTQGTFRPVCLQQDEVDPLTQVAAAARHAGVGGGPSGMDLSEAGRFPGGGGTTTEEEYSGEEDFNE